MKAANNKYLIIKPGVVLTPIIEPVIVRLDQYFHAAGLRSYVTSGLRDAHSQFKIIKRYLVAQHLDKVYPEVMKCLNPSERIGNQYVWQLAWSNLLGRGIIINPPLDAECLLDYYGPTGKGTNRKGKIIRQTPHARGTCFDIGGLGGDDATIKDELVVMNDAMKKGVPGLINILPEHNNNAIHCDCR